MLFDSKIFTVAVSLLLFVCGCRIIPNNEPLKFNNKTKTINEIKEAHFTQDAIDATRGVRFIDGVDLGKSYIIGANFWGSAVGLFTGIGMSRQVVFDLDGGGIKTVIHELIHHIDDMSRDGEVDLLSYVYFDAVYEKLSRDEKWSGLYKYSLRGYHWFTDIFGIGWRSEQIAYVGAWMAYYKSGPSYMWDVFDKVLKRP